MDNGFAEIIKVILSLGVDSIPIIAIALLAIVIYFYRKDHLEWRRQSREDFKDSIDAINKNTNTLEKVALLVQLGMGRDK